MKKFLKWALPIVILALTTLDYFFFLFIKQACIPSACGPSNPLTGAALCTEDCGGDRSYLIVYILGVVILLTLISWVILMAKKHEQKSE